MPVLAVNPAGSAISRLPEAVVKVGVNVTMPNTQTWCEIGDHV
jgi:hypothetical protein